LSRIEARRALRRWSGCAARRHSSTAQRAEEGDVGAALVIERNVLEWRCDPTSDARLPAAVGDDVEWIVLCSEGYTSSLAAASLVDLGLTRATDVIGGYHALKAAGVLPALG
jgi:rhodanese-related sulfurtransferase